MNRRKRGDDLATVKDQLTRALTRVRALRGGGACGEKYGLGKAEVTGQ
jgi:hypothetical protein